MTQQNNQNRNTNDQGGYARAKDSAADAARRASSTIEANPLAVVAGGLAVGALAGALLPRSAKEKELLAPVGKRLGDAARQAIAAAKEAGTQELDGAGLTPSSARDRGKELLGSVGKALASAGTAAAQAAKTQGKQDGGDQGKSAGQAKSGQGQSAQGQSGSGQSGQSSSGQNSGQPSDAAPTPIQA